MRITRIEQCCFSAKKLQKSMILASFGFFPKIDQKLRTQKSSIRPFHLD